MNTFWNGSCAPLANETWTVTVVDKYPTEHPCCNSCLGIDAAVAVGPERPFVLVVQCFRPVLLVVVLVRICVSE